MKTNKIEVKTIYHVELELRDFTDRLDQLKKDCDKNIILGENVYDFLVDIFGGKAFDGDVAFKKIVDSFRNMTYVSSNGTFFIKDWMKSLGFDGVENYGYYDEKKDLYFLVTYNKGCRI